MTLLTLHDIFGGIPPLDEVDMASNPGQPAHWKDVNVSCMDYNPRQDGEKLVYAPVAALHHSMDMDRNGIIDWPLQQAPRAWWPAADELSQRQSVSVEPPASWEQGLPAESPFYHHLDDQSSSDDGSLCATHTTPNSHHSPNTVAIGPDVCCDGWAFSGAAEPGPMVHGPYYSNGVHMQDIQGGVDLYPEDQDLYCSGEETFPAAYPEPDFIAAGEVDPDASTNATNQVRPSDPFTNREVRSQSAESYSGSEYSPRCRPLEAPPTHASKVVKPAKKKRARVTRTVRRTGPRKQPPGSAKHAASFQNSCGECSLVFGSQTTLQKHISVAHTRPFVCTFEIYGCKARFGSKNEWKRHVASQHLRLGVWRCDLPGCWPKPGLEDVRRSGREVDEVVYNDFNRKDLFTQHLRRMHFSASAAAGGTAKDKPLLDQWLRETSERCWSNRRAPPPHSICGFCAADQTKEPAVFSGLQSWEQRMEHVGKHLESGAGTADWVEDIGLRSWLHQEGLLERNRQGRWQLSAAAGGGKDYRGR